jgi:1,4-dihydroxy-2-naphthoyl-CoA hydrolase
MMNTEIPLDVLNSMNKNTLLEQLNIIVTKVEPTVITATMPVDKRTHQPAGLLHGGATAALIESLGSLGSSLMVDLKKQSIVGLEINVNHLRGMREGTVTGIAKVVHAGRRTHVWQVDVWNEDDKQIATGRLTVMVIDN